MFECIYLSFMMCLQIFKFKECALCHSRCVTNQVCACSNKENCFPTTLHLFFKKNYNCFFFLFTCTSNENAPPPSPVFWKRITIFFFLNVHVRGSLKKYVDFCHNFFSRRHITLGFGTHIWTTNSVDLQKKFSNLTRYFRK